MSVEITQPVVGVTPPGQGSSEASAARPASSKARRPASKQVCRFFQSKKGCRAGDACQFSHQIKDLKSKKDSLESANDDAASATRSDPVAAAAATARRSAQAVRQVDSSRVVQRPVAATATKDPRTFQIAQIKTRFAPSEDTTNDGTTALTFSMNPSDPDFPFEIQGGLRCVIQVPAAFPKQKPSLRISNKEMERGFQLNVERGFDMLWSESGNPTLLNVMKLLDRQLEAILTGQKAATIKIVVNRTVPTTPAPGTVASSTGTTLPISAPSTSTPIRPQTPPVSSQRREQARAKRQAEVQTLKHRLGRDPIFSEAANGTIFAVPLEPRKRDMLPIALKAIKSVRLYVPDAYDVEPCSIELLGVDGQEAVAVEMAFSSRARESSDMSLMAHLNYLTQNIHIMATQKNPDSSKVAATPATPENVELQVQKQLPRSVTKSSATQDDDDSHIKIIPRPLEWQARSAAGPDDFTDESSDYTTSDEDSEDDDTEDKPATEDQATSLVREKGIMLSLPHLELYGVELLELITLCLTVKCERCKDTIDVSGIKPNDKGDHTGMKQTSCKKCAVPFAIGWRKDLMHANSIRAGYLDLEGCTVVDLLPSHFITTCSDCSTPFPAPGVVAVRGDSAMAMCRECHKKMSFKIPEVKFLAVGNAQSNAARSLPKKKPKDNLGIVAGQQLPSRGRCTHYRKSYRWFRFSCCMKVFPCDKCHDAASDHPNEFANRMICGMCSREQNYRPEDCGICHSDLVGKRRTGFWEGGTGIRDQTKMSKKDPRKHKRIGTSAKVKAAKS